MPLKLGGLGGDGAGDCVFLFVGLIFLGCFGGGLGARGGLGTGCVVLAFFVGGSGP